MKETLEQAILRLTEEHGCLSYICKEGRAAALREMAAFQKERDAEIAERFIERPDGIVARLRATTIIEVAAAIRKGE